MMTHSTKTRASLFCTGLLLGLATLLPARSAHASSDFPAALKTALEAHFPGQQFCVPLCTACHNTTKGGPRDVNVFGTNLEFHGGLPPGNTNAATKVPRAIEAYFKATPGPNDSQVNGQWDSDGDGISDEQELKDLSSPSIAGPRGEGAFCTDIRYGCGARIAAVPPPADSVALFAASLAALGLIALRRRTR
jgi:hypothetical protein